MNILTLFCNNMPLSYMVILCIELNQCRSTGYIHTLSCGLFFWCKLRCVSAAPFCLKYIMVRITVWKVNFTFTCFNNLISVYRWPLGIWHIIGGFGRAPSWTPPSRAYAPPVFRKGQRPRVDTLSGCCQYFWERKKHTLRYYQLQMYISTNTHAFPFNMVYLH